jgi:hypothetical protein
MRKSGGFASALKRRSWPPEGGRYSNRAEGPPRKASATKADPRTQAEACATGRAGRLEAGATGALRGSGDGGEEFRQAEDAGVVAALALDVVYAGPVGVGFFGRGFDAGDGDFNFDAVVEAAETYLAGRFTIVVKVEAEFAGGDYGGFELLDVVVGEAGGVGEDAHGATRGGGEAFVVIEGEAKVERIFRHGYRLLAQATSQASRQSGQ